MLVEKLHILCTRGFIHNTHIHVPNYLAPPPETGVLGLTMVLSLPFIWKEALGDPTTH